MQSRDRCEDKTFDEWIKCKVGVRDVMGMLQLSMGVVKMAIYNREFLPDTFYLNIL